MIVMYLRCISSQKRGKKKKPHLALLDLACEGFEDLAGRHSPGPMLAMQVGVHPRFCLVLKAIGSNHRVVGFCRRRLTP